MATPTPPNSVHLHRVIKCPPDRLYRAFIDPRALVKWLPPHGFVAEMHSCNPIVGDGYRMSFINLGTGAAHSFSCTFTEMVPGVKLRHTDRFDDPNLPGEMAVTVNFKKVVCGTELSISQENIPPQIPAEMCNLGWQESLSLLIALVEPEIA